MFGPKDREDALAEGEGWVGMKGVVWMGRGEDGIVDGERGPEGGGDFANSWAVGRGWFG